MSFIKGLTKNREDEKILQSQVIPDAINMVGATAGLASTVSNMREPYRVNGPINAVTTPAVRSRMLQA
jgi:hypothetical protein